MIKFLLKIRGNLAIPNVSTGLAIGDSTIAPGNGKAYGIADIFFTTEEKAAGNICHSQAVPGDTIAGQRAIWNANNNKTQYDWVVVQIGLNDMDTTDINGTIGAYQDFINSIRSGGKAELIIVASCMLPCKQRWTDLGWANGQSNWIALNNAIMSTITNVDKRLDSHVAVLGDGNGNLKSEYDSGDHIHENDAGAVVIKDAWRSCFAL